MARKLPKGTCPVCGRKVAKRITGRVRRHRDGRVDERNGPWPVCRGSGEMATEHLLTPQGGQR